MTIEEAAKILADDYSLCLSECEGDCNKCVKGAKEMAIEALEKQIPKKPIKKTNFGSDILDGKYCPCCDSMFDRTTKFCVSCGQAIDWSDFQ